MGGWSPGRDSVEAPAAAGVRANRFRAPFDVVVDDIEQAVSEAESKGAVVAYPPTQQGDTGTWAIYMMGGVQIGLWQA